MAKSSFKAVIEIRGINPFIRVSASRVATLKPGWRKPLPVLLRINGKPEEVHRTNMMPAGNGSFYLYLNGSVRSASGASIGDRVSVEIEFDADYQSGPQHPMPAWFRDALKENPQARQNWEALTPSRKKEILLANDQIGRWALWGFVALLTSGYASSIVGPPPKDVQSIAYSALFLWIFVPWAYWIDAHRKFRLGNSE